MVAKITETLVLIMCK